MKQTKTDVLLDVIREECKKIDDQMAGGALVEAINHFGEYYTMKLMAKLLEASRIYLDVAGAEITRAKMHNKAAVGVLEKLNSEHGPGAA